MLPRPEMKKTYKSIEAQQTQVDQNVLGPVQTPFRMATGSSGLTRDGNQINLRGIHVKGHFFNRPTSGKVFKVRMVIIEDKRSNSTIFTGDQFLIKNGVPVNHDQGFESSYLGINKARYKVYSDKLITLGSSSDSADNVKMFNTFVKLSGVARYSDTSSLSLENRNIQVAYWPITAGGQLPIAQYIEATYCVTGFYQDP